MQGCTKYCKLSSTDGVSTLIKHIQDKYNFDLKSVGGRSLEIEFQYPTLESIESLWSDYRSGLNDITKRYYVSHSWTKVCKPLTELLPLILLRFYQLSHECLISGNPINTYAK